MEQQIFKVDNQYLAYAIHYITNEVFQKRVNSEGKTIYTFIKNDKVIKAQRQLKDYKYEN